ncbi:MAG: hypothetical protein QXG65_03930 [Thermoplasmata archaeon]
MPTSRTTAGAASPPLVWSGEGATPLWLPAMPAHRGPGRRAPVFYNPAMAVDRDLNLAILNAARAHRREPMDAWEMLGATGVRGLRWATETEALRSLTITERAPEALAVLSRNAASAGSRVPVHVEDRDARVPWDDGRRFAYVDLDPYGSPLPYLSSLWSAVGPGSLVAVTATDMMVLAGAIPGACERIYGARPLRGRLAPEGGLRILLAGLARSARERGLRVRPVLSYVHDHHVRAYLEVVRSGPADAEDPIGRIDPGSWAGPSLGGRPPFGPLWLGALHDREWVDSLLPPLTAADPRRVADAIGRFREEARVDVPFYYEPNELAREAGLPRPPSLASLIGRILAAGHAAARGHPRPTAIRTDADRSTLLRLVREPPDPATDRP